MAGPGERFEIERRVGAGATSQVFRAHDRSTGATVALKIGTTPDARSIFAREAERAASAMSPFVPELVDVGVLPEGAGEHAGAPYLALTWVDGSPVDVLASRTPEARRALALAVAQDVGAALADLHSAGVAHGDVKPANVLVASAGAGLRARLVDLGLSGDADAPAAGGTPRYLAPETWTASGPGDARARDRLALGLVLAEILDEGVARSDHPVDAARRATLPPPFASLVGALLAPDPGARPRASWVAEQARRVLGDDPAEVRAARDRRAVRTTYVASRQAEIARAARARAVEVRTTGGPGDWLRSAIELAARCATLRGEDRSDDRGVLGDADELARARWLVALVGSPAAEWPLGALAAANDGAWAQAMLGLSDRRAPACWEPQDLEQALVGSLPPRAAAARRKREGADASVELAMALAAGVPDRAAIDEVEASATAPPALRRAAADALRRLGENGRALAMLAGDGSGEARSLRADVARRAGDHALAAREAEAALALDADDDVALAVSARLRVDAGDAAGALARLEHAPRGPRVVETRAIALVMLGDRQAAEGEVARAAALASTEESRARIAGLAGYVAHAGGEATRAAAAFERAADHAARAGALVEEATYRTGEAAAACDHGDVGRALHASRRAALLWEHLGRPRDAARALLARAAAFATAGAKDEAIGAANEARERARALGDPRAEAYACWAICDVLDEAAPEAIRAARDAAGLLSASVGEGVAGAEDALRALARVLRHAPADLDVERLARADELASVDATAPGARLEWWGARAGAALSGTAGGRADAIVREVRRLVDAPCAVASRGPALCAAARLAAREGDGESLRLLVRAATEAARGLVALTPGDLRASVAALPWIGRAPALDSPGLSSEQIADVEALVRALGTRDRLRPLLEQALDSLVLWTGVERGLLLLVAPGGKLVARAARNLARSDLEGEQRVLSQSIARKAMEEGGPVVAVDASGEMSSLHASVHALKLRSVLAVPLVARGEALGVVYLDDRVRRGAFGARELAWVRVVASLSAVAIADARDQLLLRRAARRAERAKQALAKELAQREAELDVAERELARARDARETRFRYDAIVGKSERIGAMLALVDRVTVSSVPVLLIGESGSGKELVARAIHANGPRGKQAFVGENCAAIPEPLLESTLFGHARGAFTGADRPRAGLFEVADRGTLFLDEIGEMSLTMQTKLLRVLEQGEVHPLGTERGRKVDVRIVAATHRDLDQMVKDGRFREDLFYRLNVIAIRLPPLRERADDVPLLVQHFVAKHAGGGAVRVSREAMALLSRFGWPGNVRQLENEIRRAIVLSDGTILPEHLSRELREASESAEKRAHGLHVRSRVDALEAELVREAMARTRGNQTRAAELLGLSRFGLQKMIKRLEIKA